MKKAVAFIFIAFSWPICLMHRLMNDWPVQKVRWIILDNTVLQDRQWYICDSGNMLSNIFFIFGVWLIVGKISKNIRILVGALLIIALMDFCHYWLYFKRSEYVAFVEGLIMVVASILIFTHESTRNSHAKTD